MSRPVENDRGRAKIACSLESGAAAQRHARWQALREHALVDAEHIDGGLRLVFRADPGVATELQELVELERKCCAFADWSVQADSKRVALEVSGDSDEAIAAVHGMFPYPSPLSSR